MGHALVLGEFIGSVFEGRVSGVTLIATGSLFIGVQVISHVLIELDKRNERTGFAFGGVHLLASVVSMQKVALFTFDYFLSGGVVGDGIGVGGEGDTRGVVHDSIGGSVDVTSGALRTGVPPGGPSGAIGNSSASQDSQFIGTSGRLEPRLASGTKNDSFIGEGLGGDQGRVEGGSVVVEIENGESAVGDMKDYVIGGGDAQSGFDTSGG